MAPYHHRLFELTGPPRGVPLLVWLRIMFGGINNQIGWTFFGFGMIFFWVFAPNADLASWYVFREPLSRAPGRILSCEETSASEGGSKHRKGTPIYALGYEFTHEQQRQEAVCYSTGKALEPGAAVTVEFPAGNPLRSRIEGMRTHLFGPGVALVGLFPLVGFAFLAFGVRKSRKLVRLLRHGKQAEGTLKSKEPTNTTVNKQRVYKLTFEFTDDLGQTHEAVAKTHEPERLEDDEHEPLLYDPADPKCATLLDHLPGSPQIDRHGAIATDRPLMSLAVLAAPLMAVAVNAVGVYVHFLK